MSRKKKAGVSANTPAKDNQGTDENDSRFAKAKAKRASARTAGQKIAEPNEPKPLERPSSIEDLKELNERARKNASSGEQASAKSKTVRESNNQNEVEGDPTPQQVKGMSKSSVALDKSSEEALVQSLREFFNSHGMQGRAVAELCTKAASTYFADLARGYALPQELPKPGEIPLYEKRKDPDQDPISFYREHWRIYEEARLVYRPTLNAFDPKLLASMSTYCSNRNMSDEERAKRLPPTKTDQLVDTFRASGLTIREIYSFARFFQRNRIKDMSDLDRLVNPENKLVRT